MNIRCVRIKPTLYPISKRDNNFPWLSSPLLSSRLIRNSQIHARRKRHVLWTTGYPQDPPVPRARDFPLRPFYNLWDACVLQIAHTRALIALHRAAHVSLNHNRGRGYITRCRRRKAFRIISGTPWKSDKEVRTMSLDTVNVSRDSDQGEFLMFFTNGAEFIPP